MKNSYAINRGTVDQPHNNTNDLVVDYTKYNSKKDYMREVSKVMKSYGLVLVKNRGLDTEDIIKDFGGEVFESCYGRIEDLKTNNTTNKNNDQLGYTNAAVDLHTDLPFIDSPPEFQLLQCINPAQKGGENYFVNAVALAKYLRFIDKSAYDILTKFEVSFHRQLSNYTSIYNTPIIRLDEKEEPYQVRSSYFTYAPFKYDFHQMEAFYRAYSKLTKMSLFYKYNATLSSGDFVLYNNHTMFHARTAFTGDRHMRGVYFSGEQIRTTLNNI
jgi:gamma-butyrobetaine dioxygenase/trimethyllysine dioxygenase